MFCCKIAGCLDIFFKFATNSTYENDAGVVRKRPEPPESRMGLMLPRHVVSIDARTLDGALQSGPGSGRMPVREWNRVRLLFTLRLQAQRAELAISRSCCPHSVWFFHSSGIRPVANGRAYPKAHPCSNRFREERSRPSIIPPATSPLRGSRPVRRAPPPMFTANLSLHRRDIRGSFKLKIAHWKNLLGAV